MTKFGLIGKSLGHSFSKEFFTNYFQERQIDAIYENIELDSIEDFEKVKSDFNGFNVTIPYKEAVIPFLDDLDPVAQNIGAVNTIKRIGDRFIGYNTDAFGFHQSIKPFLTNKHERALILGTGGASKAVAYVLEELGIDVFYISRKPVGERQYSWGEINDQMIRSCKLIVNCTPLGMYPKVEQCPEIPFKELTSDHLVVDLIYNPEKTRFLQSAEENGASILNGGSMLKEQALRSYSIWMK